MINYEIGLINKLNHCPDLFCLETSLVCILIGVIRTVNIIQFFSGGQDIIISDNQKIYRRCFDITISKLAVSILPGRSVINNSHRDRKWHRS